MARLRTAALVAAYVIALVAALATLPTMLALTAALLLTILLVLADALGNRILFKMAVRNVVRRPGTTALVLAGLMVGTAIISATLVVGDTFDSMIVGRSPTPMAKPISSSAAPGAAMGCTTSPTSRR